jgi:hypothetical protein
MMEAQSAAVDAVGRGGFAGGRLCAGEPGMTEAQAVGVEAAGHGRAAGA